MSKLRYKLNPCDYEHYTWLTPAQKVFEFFSMGTECKCCLGARIAAALVIGFLIGKVF